MNKAPNLHSNFFSSLKQVEKRLKLETPSPSLILSPPEPQPPAGDYSSAESLSSPIFLNFDRYNHHQHANQSSILECSETPHEFLSNSDDFPSTHESPLSRPPENFPEIVDSSEHDDLDEIGLLIQLLGLSDCEDDEAKLRLKSCSSCRCGRGFYDKIVGVKGPKCDKEMERLDGWIRRFREERIEPLRMAHLLLGKVAFFSGDGGGFEAFEFPSTVEELLQNDPPIE